MSSSGDETEPRRYLTDDRDFAEEDQHELVISRGGNGDWYLGVWPKGARYCPNTVRICTSGGASTTVPALPVLAARMYRALDYEKRDLANLPFHLENLPPAKCVHPEGSIVALPNGDGKCTRCQEVGFPITPEAAGMTPCCGSFGDCARGCDGKERQPFAEARALLRKLATQAEDDGTPESAFAAKMLKEMGPALRRIRFNGFELPDGELIATGIILNGENPWLRYEGGELVSIRCEIATSYDELQKALEPIGYELLYQRSLNKKEGSATWLVRPLSTRVETT